MKCITVNGEQFHSVVLQAAPIDENVDLLKYTDTLANDPYFSYMFTCIYQLTPIDVSVRVEIDEESQISIMYVYVNTIPSTVLLRSMRDKLPIFVSTVGRMTNVLYESVTPFSMNNLTDVSDNDRSQVSIHGTISSSLMEAYGAPTNQRYIIPYGLSIDLNIINGSEIRKRFPHYSILTHPEMYEEYIKPSVDRAIAFLTQRLDPLGAMSIHFKVQYIVDEGFFDLTQVSLKAVLTIDQINGIEIYSISNTEMAFRPVRPGMTMDKMDEVEWNDAYPYIEQIATAVFSDNGTLFIPQITSVDTSYHNGKEWIHVYMTPHFAHFTKNQIFYGNKEMVERYGSEYYWLTGGMGAHMQFIFPSLGPLNNPLVLCYGRVMKDFLLKNKNAIFHQLSCKEIHMRIVAEIDNWIYFALCDITIPHYMSTFIHFNEYFVAEAASNEDNDDAINSILEMLVIAFCSTDPDTIMNVIPDANWKSIMEAAHNDELLAIISCWEHAVMMGRRSFYDKYHAVRDRILQITREANQEALRNAAIKPEDREPLCPAMPQVGLRRFQPMGKIPSEGTTSKFKPIGDKPKKGSIFKSIFRPDN